MKLVRKSTTHNPHVNQQTKIRNTQKQRHDANTNPPYNWTEMLLGWVCLDVAMQLIEK